MPKINVYLPDDLAEQVRAHDVPVSAICQAALRKELDRMNTKELTGMEEIQVEIGDQRDVGATLTASFIGRWLVAPDEDETRTGMEGWDPGQYWGVALTKRGRIAVFTAHCNDRWPARLDDYDTLDDAAGGLPEDILAMAKSELGEEYVIRLDI